MIKVTGTNRVNGKRLIVLGLSDENITQLVNRRPIYFDGSELGIDGTVLIFHEMTEKDLEETTRVIYERGVWKAT